MSAELGIVDAVSVDQDRNRILLTVFLGAGRTERELPFRGQSKGTWVVPEIDDVVEVYRTAGGEKAARFPHSTPEYTMPDGLVEGDLAVTTEEGTSVVIKKDGTIDVDASTEITVDSDGNISINSKSVLDLDGTTEVTINSGGGITIDSSAALDLDGASEVTIDSGGNVKINGGTKGVIHDLTLSKDGDGHVTDVTIERRSDILI